MCDAKLSLGSAYCSEGLELSLILRKKRSLVRLISSLFFCSKKGAACFRLFGEPLMNIQLAQLLILAWNSSVPSVYIYKLGSNRYVHLPAESFLLAPLPKKKKEKETRTEKMTKICCSVLVQNSDLHAWWNGWITLLANANRMTTIMVRRIQQNQMVCKNGLSQCRAYWGPGSPVSRKPEFGRERQLTIHGSNLLQQKKEDIWQFKRRAGVTGWRKIAWVGYPDYEYKANLWREREIERKDQFT